MIAGLVAQPSERPHHGSPRCRCGWHHFREPRPHPRKHRERIEVPAVGLRDVRGTRGVQDGISWLVCGHGESGCTSQLCSHCGFSYEDNCDDKQSACQDCRYEVNADYNAAKSIANRYCGYIHHGQNSCGGWAGNQLALNSGTSNVTGDYTPAE
ncbi:MAG: transposase [Haloquadratum sp. J07HQX50]|nr:MAG: transposase [Haloquadratum sp. J07HQX50]